MSRGRARFTESDIGRIMKAAARAGVSAAIDFAGDGRIARVIINSSITAARASLGGVNPWDDAIAELTAGSS
jgi:hypothetical protein